MLKLSDKEYKLLKRFVSTRNFERINLPRPALSSILVQKIVSYVRRRYNIYMSRIGDIKKGWLNGRLPKWFSAPPVVKARIIMKALDYSKSEIRRCLKNPDRIDDERLRKYVWRAVKTDFVYSPIAVRFHSAKGEVCERLLKSFLDSIDVSYSEEKDLRGKTKKTPDFLLEDPLEMCGIKVMWMESKAMFGGTDVHSEYWKRQYRYYIEEFGKGIVVYWFGCVKDLCCSITGDEIGVKVNMNVYVEDDGIEIGEGVEFIKSMERLAEIFRRGDEIRIRPNKNAVMLLSRLGFNLIRR